MPLYFLRFVIWATSTLSVIMYYVKWNVQFFYIVVFFSREQIVSLVSYNWRHVSRDVVRKTRCNIHMGTIITSLCKNHEMSSRVWVRITRCHQKYFWFYKYNIFFHLQYIICKSFILCSFQVHFSFVLFIKHFQIIISS